MKEIKFRGKAVESGDVVFGYYVFCRGHHYILQTYNENGYDDRWETSDWIEVDADSVGQYIGCKDKNGVEIFSGDIGKERECMFVVEWGMYGWSPFEYCGGGECDVENVEIIGNRVDNPELLEKLGSAS